MRTGCSVAAAVPEFLSLAVSLASLGMGNGVER